MNKTWKIASLACLGTASLTLAFYVGRARAAGTPQTTPMTYSGTLQAVDGSPVTGTHTLQVTVWNAETGTAEPVCQSLSTAVTLQAGRFFVTLPETCKSVVKTYPDLWAELILDGNTLGRSKVGAIPFALEADHALVADNAAGALKTAIEGLTARQTRIVSARDTRTGCPPPAQPNTDLVTISFTLAKATAVSITGKDLRYAAGRADLTLLVDGVVVSGAVTYTPDTQWDMANVEWAGVLQAGAHSASLRGSGAANIWGCSNNEIWGELTALIFE